MTQEQVNQAVVRWLMPIFDVDTSIAAIATAKSKAEDIKKQLSDLGMDVNVLDIATEADDGQEGGASEDGESGEESWSEIDGSDVEMK